MYNINTSEATPSHWFPSSLARDLYEWLVAYFRVPHSKEPEFSIKFSLRQIAFTKARQTKCNTFVSVPPPNIQKSIASFEDSQVSPICPHKSPRVEENVQYSGRRIKKEKTEY